MADASTTPVTSGAGPQLVVCHVADKGSHDAFATAFILTGNVITAWGGEVITADDLAQLPKSSRIHSVQIEDNLFLKPPEGSQTELADLIVLSRKPPLNVMGWYAGHFSPYLPRSAARLKDQEPLIKSHLVNNGRRQPIKAMS